jgi:DNA-binding GntR family transcriptional regulator
LLKIKTRPRKAEAVTAKVNRKRGKRETSAQSSLRRPELALDRTRIDDRLSKSDQVYEIIRAAIISMKFRPGALIVEKEICRQLDISRTPLREAILQLANENLVIVRPGGGTFVNQIILRDVLNGQITRDTLEMRLVRLAARNFRPEFADELEVNLLRQKLAAERKDASEFFELDNQFHRLVCNCSGFPNAWHTIHGATGQLDRVRRHAFLTENNYLEVRSEHAQIYECIKRNDEDGAAAAFQTQLDSTMTTTIELIRSLEPDLLTYDGHVSIHDIR